MISESNRNTLNQAALQLQQSSFFYCLHTLRDQQQRVLQSALMWTDDTVGSKNYAELKTP